MCEQPGQGQFRLSGADVHLLEKIGSQSERNPVTEKIVRERMEMFQRRMNCHNDDVLRSSDVGMSW